MEQQQQNTYPIPSSCTVDLPPDWIEVADPASGNLYYANLSTGKTSWDPPRPEVVDHSHQPSGASLNATGPSTNLVPAVTAVASLATTATHATMLVPTVRRMIESEQYSQGRCPTVELSGLSAGQIADLCVLQQEDYRADRDDDRELEPYTPLYPYEMDERARRPPMESARLEVRMHSLYEQIRQIR